MSKINERHKKNFYIAYLIIFILTLPFSILFWVVLFFLFKNSIAPTLEYGSVSDWVSSISTALTLLVAWQAYKAAPDWLKQKHDEQTLELAAKLIESENDKLIKLKKDLFDTGGDFSKSVRVCYRHHDNQRAHALSGKYKELISDLSLQVENTEKIISSLIRRGWTLKSNYYGKYKEIDSKLNGSLVSNFFELTYIAFLTESKHIKNWEESFEKIPKQDISFANFDQSIAELNYILTEYTDSIKNEKMYLKDFFDINRD
ncbi:hypothetical protein NXS97_05505 [Pantoea sp. B623]|uniref:hypothetical protein n=1 Tax=Pantoea TaxID=53335 RepID=UPI000E269CF8|nr:MULTISPECIES: hypothetical protein [Pantoea]MCS4493663.1 hypothetical protein [Pantoea sp. B623]REF11556.1 hypothetical protein C7428_0764 [Pantoea ananatis]